MAEVIPALNCAYREDQCLTARAGLLRIFNSAAHLDVSDGAFTFTKSWNNPELWSDVGTGIPLEVHLMTIDPLAEAVRWLKAGAARIVVPIEVVPPAKSGILGEIAAHCHAYGARLALSVNPETPPEKLAEYFPLVEAFHILSVHPGPSGQKFLPLSQEKIKFIRREKPDAEIAVDGGINYQNIISVAELGVTRIIAGASIWSELNPLRAYRELSALAAG